MKVTLPKLICHLAKYAPTNLARILLLRLAQVKVGRSVHIGYGVLVGEGAIIGDDCVIGRKSIIGTKSSLGSRVHIGSEVSLYEARVDDDAIIGHGTKISKISIGKRSQIETSVLCTGFQDGDISVGSDSYIGIGAVLDWSGGINIGNFVHIAGPSTGLWTHTSVFQALLGDRLNNQEHKETGQIVIEDNVWIGGNCTIYPGVKIEHHTVILPNSAINGDIPASSMAGGTPCKLLRKIQMEGTNIVFKHI
jgi:acetyltransferase-like isoleucine patch superfamily enzyme